MTPKSKRKSIHSRMLRPVSRAFGEQFMCPVYILSHEAAAPVTQHIILLLNDVKRFTQWCRVAVLGLCNWSLIGLSNNFRDGV